jgi:hypothetical protein
LNSPGIPVRVKLAMGTQRTKPSGFSWWLILEQLKEDE